MDELQKSKDTTSSKIDLTISGKSTDDDNNDNYFRQNESWPEWTLKTFIAIVLALGFLYLFLVGLALLGDAFKVVAGASGAEMFAAVDNPLAGLMVGILATVLFQSSSTTTSIIVAAVGAEVLPVQQAIPMIFGANIGTSVTNTLVSLTFVKSVEQYRRGFAGATVHDMFNYINVALWFPLEVITNAMNGGNGGILFLLTEAIAKTFTACDSSKDDCEKWVGPFKIITKEFSKKIISVDKDVLKDITKGRPGSGPQDCQWMADNWDSHYKFKSKRCTIFDTADKGICPDDCPDDYILDCQDEDKTCRCMEDKDKNKVQFTWCYDDLSTAPAVHWSVRPQVLADAQAHFDDFHLNKGGVWYDAGLDDGAAGGLTLTLALIMITASLIGLVKVLTFLVQGSAEHLIKRALDMHSLIAILLGIGLTVLVQSSSITTSTLTPLVAMGIMTLEKMFAFTVGANIGTTCTGILASLVGTSELGFQIAMVHFMFNIFGATILYPIPFVRNIPLKIARKLGDMAAAFRPFPFVYIILVFFIYPGFFLLLSLGFESSNGGMVALGVIGLLAFLVWHAYIFYWTYYKGGKQKMAEWIKARDLKYTIEEANEEANMATSIELGTGGAASPKGDAQSG